MASITCGHCGKTHHAAATVKRCSRGELFVCDWLIEIPAGGYWIEGEWYEREAGTRECGAAAWEIPGGHTCEAGHEHISAQARAEQGWDYAADDQEARQLATYGVEPRDMEAGRVMMPR